MCYVLCWLYTVRCWCYVLHCSLIQLFTLRYTSETLHKMGSSGGVSIWSHFTYLLCAVFLYCASGLISRGDVLMHDVQCLIKYLFWSLHQRLIMSRDDTTTDTHARPTTENNRTVKHTELHPQKWVKSTNSSLCLNTEMLLTLTLSLDKLFQILITR